MNEANLTEFSQECIRRVYTLAAVEMAFRTAVDPVLDPEVRVEDVAAARVCASLEDLFPETIATFVEQTLHSDSELKD